MWQNQNQEKPRGSCCWWWLAVFDSKACLRSRGDGLMLLSRCHARDNFAWRKRETVSLLGTKTQKHYVAFTTKPEKMKPKLLLSFLTQLNWKMDGSKVMFPTRPELSCLIGLHWVPLLWIALVGRLELMLLNLPTEGQELRWDGLLWQVGSAVGFWTGLNCKMWTAG